MDDNRRKAIFSWCLYDWANSAFATVILAAVLPVYFVSLVPEQGAVLPFISGHRFSATALWGYSVSFSVLIIACSAPLLGLLADRRGWHKPLLLSFCLTGSMATMLLWQTPGNGYLWAAILFIVGNIGFAGGNIFYNAYLPLLVDQHQVDRLSARGFAYGYMGGGLLLALVFALILNYRGFGFADAAGATRFSFLLTGLWWLIFSLPAFRRLPPTKKIRTSQSGSSQNNLAVIRQLLRHRDLLLFLLAFLCYNDGIQTVISVSAIFAREELRLSQTTILGCFIMIQFLAMPGALLFGRLAGIMGTARAILLSLFGFICVCGAAYGLTGATGFWLLGGVIALILGGSQALSRSLFAGMVPTHQSAEFFGFFAISSRFAAVLGPFSFALITDLSGNIRNSLLALAIFFVLGSLLLLLVNVDRGRDLAVRLTKRLNHKPPPEEPRQRLR